MQNRGIGEKEVYITLPASYHPRYFPAHDFLSRPLYLVAWNRLPSYNLTPLSLQLFEVLSNTSLIKSVSFFIVIVAPFFSTH